VDVNSLFELFESYFVAQEVSVVPLVGQLKYLFKFVKVYALFNAKGLQSARYFIDHFLRHLYATFKLPGSFIFKQLRVHITVNKFLLLLQLDSIFLLETYGFRRRSVGSAALNFQVSGSNRSFNIVNVFQRGLLNVTNNFTPVFLSHCLKFILFLENCVHLVRLHHLFHEVVTAHLLCLRESLLPLCNFPSLTIELCVKRVEG
jgi:hypothetical protein